MRTTLLVIAVLSLVVGFWLAWAHFQGNITRDELLNWFGVCTLVWFVCATAWAYMKPKGA
jgi:hypothetical protein